MLSMIRIVKENKPVGFTGVLLLVAVAYILFLSHSYSHSVSLWVDVVFLTLFSGAAFIVLLAGLRLKNNHLKVFTLFANGIFFAIGLLMMGTFLILVMVI